MVRRLTLITLTLTLVVGGVAIGPAAAASGHASGSVHNGTVNASASTGTSAKIIHESVGHSLGTATLKAWTYNQTTGALKLRFKAKTPTMISVSDRGRADQKHSQASGPGGAAIPSTTHTLHSGANTVTIHPYAFSTRGGKKSIDVAVGGTASGWEIWTTGLGGSSHPPVKWSTVEALVGLVALGTAWLTYRRVRSRLDDNDHGARRVL